VRGEFGERLAAWAAHAHEKRVTARLLEYARYARDVLDGESVLD
jgi:hypothetical protein